MHYRWGTYLCHGFRWTDPTFRSAFHQAERYDRILPSPCQVNKSNQLQKKIALKLILCYTAGRQPPYRLGLSLVIEV